MRIINLNTTGLSWKHKEQGLCYSPENALIPG